MRILILHNRSHEYRISMGVHHLLIHPFELGRGTACKVCREHGLEAMGSGGSKRNRFGQKVVPHPPYTAMFRKPRIWCGTTF